jgi:NADPH:quinone reductase-like Zn-dependent oxidoreductase
VSLNRGECRRLLSAKAGWVPGWDVAGRVVAPAADGSGPPAGSRVVGLADAGGWAQRAAVPTNRLSEIPADLSAVAASTLPVAGMTALLALRRGGQLLGRRVAVTGATGGVGGFALQLAALAGAHTTAVVSSRDRTRGLPFRGVDAVEVGLEGDGADFDLVLESVGGALLAAALGRVAPGGLVVTYGGTSAEDTAFPVTTFYPRNGAALSAFQLFRELDRDRPGGRHLATLAGLVVGGHLDVPVHTEHSWDEGARVVRALLDRQIPGKAVLTID